jgi:hypothetical protein
MTESNWSFSWPSLGKQPRRGLANAPARPGDSDHLVFDLYDRLLELMETTLDLPQRESLSATE